MKTFKINQTIYNEIVNSKIAKFPLLGYKDDKGKECDERLLILLPKYQREKMHEYYDIDLDEFKLENEVIFECEYNETVKCIFSQPIEKYSKGYLRKIKDVELFSKDNNDEKKDDKFVVTNDEDVVESFFYTNQPNLRKSKNSSLQFTLMGNAHKIMKIIDFTNIKYIKFQKDGLLKIISVKLKQIDKNEYVMKIFYDSINAPISISLHNFIGTFIDTMDDNFVLEFMQNKELSKYIDLTYLNLERENIIYKQKSIQNDNVKFNSKLPDINNEKEKEEKIKREEGQILTLDRYFYIKRDLSKSNVFQIRLKKECQEIFKLIDLTKIQHIIDENNINFIIIQSTLTKTVDGDYIFKSLIKKVDDTLRLIKRKSYKSFEIPTNLQKLKFELLQSVDSKEYVNLKEMLKLVKKENQKQEISSIANIDKFLDQKDFLIASYANIKSNQFSYMIDESNLKRLHDLSTVHYLVVINDVYRIENVKIESYKKNQILLTGKVLQQFKSKNYYSLEMDGLFNISMKNDDDMDFLYLKHHSYTNIEISRAKKKYYLPLFFSNYDANVLNESLVIKLKLNKPLMKILPRISSLLSINKITHIVKNYEFNSIEVKNKVISIKLQPGVQVMIDQSINKHNYEIINPEANIYGYYQLNLSLVKVADLNKLLKGKIGILKNDAINKIKNEQEYQTKIQNSKNTQDIQDAYDHRYTINYRGKLRIDFLDFEFYQEIIHSNGYTLDTAKVKGNIYSPNEIRNIKVQITYKTLYPVYGTCNIKNYSVKLNVFSDETSNTQMLTQSLIIKDSNYSTSYLDFFNHDKTKERLQLILSANNHATRKHNISEEVIQMVYYDKQLDLFNTFHGSTFYCRCSWT